MKPTPIIRTVGLSSSYDQWGTTKEVLRGIDLAVASGSWVLIMGANGSGKTTLFRCLLGEIPHQGRIELPGSPDSVIYSVLQNPLAGTAIGLSAFENIWMIDRDAPTRRSEAMIKYATLLEPYNLHGALSQAVETLSGGQRQILSVLMASLTNRPIILLDEPTSALDDANETFCLQAMNQLHQTGRTLVQITHDANHAQWATRIVTLFNGQISADTRP
jgi:ABC-type multidrug transport system ATPase subunit